MVEVNALGENCPIPIVKTKRVFDTLQQSDYVVTLVSEEMQANNVVKFAGKYGYEATIEKISDEEWHVTTKAIIGGKEIVEQSACECAMNAKRNVVYSFSSNKMGCGSDELGSALMKAFIYTVTQQDELPTTMLFYNGAAYLTCEDSPVLGDLQDLAARGVEIITCGTCLNFFGITDMLQVGEVSNMYDIHERLAKADHIVKP